MVFLQLLLDPGVYSRVTAGMAFQNSFLFSDVRTSVWVRWTLQESKQGLSGQHGRLRIRGGRPTVTF